MTKTRIVFGVLILITVAVITYLLTDKTSKTEPGTSPQAIRTHVNEYPNLQMNTLDGKLIHVRDLTGNNILVFFQTDCDHCQREAKEFSENIQVFASYQLYFITVGTKQDIEVFAKDYGLNNHANVSFAQTTLDQILNGVGPISAPAVYIFREGKLIKNFDGEKPLAEIRPWL
jgi:cytochrome oxidase Cu insertion factor (SCO1/SenC/PrrC family)